MLSKQSVKTNSQYKICQRKRRKKCSESSLEQMMTKKNFIAECCAKEFSNNSSSFLSTQYRSKSAVDLTTPRFRMLVNAEDFARPFEAKVDNNLPPERYSNVDLIIHFSEIAYGGLNDSTLSLLIEGRRIFRRLYFNFTYCLYFEKLTINSSLIMYRLNTIPKPGIWIDQIIQWYPIFPNRSEEDGNENRYSKILSIDQERLSFWQHLKLEFREILLEYYEITNSISHNSISKLIVDVENFIAKLVDKCFLPFERVNEICKKCGESFESKTDLISHHDFNSCRLPPIHRCQCGNVFYTHSGWQNHCLNVTMECSSFAWHIWRHKRSVKIYNFTCDGCQHIFTGFIKFWNHCCFCPFFLAYFIGNCPLCTPQTRLEFYQHPETQLKISQPHSDKIGITIIKNWASITNNTFNVKLATPEEPLLKN